MNRTINHGDLLRSKNLKITPQRAIILDKIYQKGHLGVDELYEDIKAEYPAISLATVYKNIASLIEADIVKEIKVPNQKQKYEIRTKPHIHLYCNKCGSLVDVDFDPSILADSVSKSHNFKPEEYSIAIMGICSECR